MTINELVRVLVVNRGVDAREAQLDLLAISCEVDVSGEGWPSDHVMDEATTDALLAKYNAQSGWVA